MSEIDLAVLDGVAWITLNRPARLNAFTVPMFEALAAALRLVEDDAAVRVVVLTGAGRGFCAGGDPVAIIAASEGMSEAARLQRMARWHEIPQIIRRMAKPVVAGLNGPAAGMGLALALACDLRIAAESAKCVTGFAAVGFSGDFGMPWFLTRLIGEGRARQLLFLNETLSAAEAYGLGLVNELVPDAEFRAALQAVTARLVATAPLALAGMKQNFAAAAELGLSDYLAQEGATMVRSAMSADHREIMTARAEGRAPRFQAR